MVIMFTEEDTESQPEEETNRVESKNIPTERLLLSSGWVTLPALVIIHTVLPMLEAYPSFSDQSFY